MRARRGRRGGRGGGGGGSGEGAGATGHQEAQKKPRSTLATITNQPTAVARKPEGQESRKLMAELEDEEKEEADGRELVATTCMT